MSRAGKQCSPGEQKVSQIAPWRVKVCGQCNLLDMLRATGKLSFVPFKVSWERNSHKRFQLLLCARSPFCAQWNRLSHCAPSGSALLPAASSLQPSSTCLAVSMKALGTSILQKVLVLVVVMSMLLWWQTFDCDDFSVSRDDFWINKTKKDHYLKVADRVEVSLKTLVSPSFCACVRKWEHLARETRVILWSDFHCRISKLL